MRTVRLLFAFAITLLPWGVGLLTALAYQYWGMDADLASLIGSIVIVVGLFSLIPTGVVLCELLDHLMRRN